MNVVLSLTLSFTLIQILSIKNFSANYDNYKMAIYTKVSNGAKIRNRYNQVPHLTQDTNGKVTNSQKTPQTRAKRPALSQQVTTKHIKTRLGKLEDWNLFKILILSVLHISPPEHVFPKSTIKTISPKVNVKSIKNRNQIQHLLTD